MWVQPRSHAVSGPHAGPDPRQRVAPSGLYATTNENESRFLPFYFRGNIMPEIKSMGLVTKILRWFQKVFAPNHGASSSPVADQSPFQIYIETSRRKATQLQEAKSNNRKRTNSREWKRAKKLALERANYQCEQCQVKPATAVRYNDSRLYRSAIDADTFDPSDLIALCDGCNKERAYPSDWDDPQHPFYPENDSKKAKVPIKAQGNPHEQLKFPNL